MKNTLYMVIPCYNEEEVILETTKRLHEKYDDLIKRKLISKKSKILYVNDGSKDKTWELILKITKEDSYFSGISLSRNIMPMLLFLWMPICKMIFIL